MDDKTWAIPSGMTLTDGQTSAYWARMLYVNVHSDAYKGGELRAQLKPWPNAAPTRSPNPRPAFRRAP